MQASEEMCRGEAKNAAVGSMEIAFMPYEICSTGFCDRDGRVD